jgi:hypothetical protein
MTTQIVYDAAGKAIELEPVDAREYLASGAYFASKAKAKSADVVADVAAPAVDEVTEPEPEKVRNKPGPKPKVKD